MSRENLEPGGSPDWGRVRSLVDRYVRSLGLSYDDAEDVAQQAAVRLWRQWHTFRGRAQRSSWIYRVVRNEFHSWRRRQSKHGLPPKLEASPTDLEPSPEDQLLSAVVAEKLLSGLRKKDREILELRYFVGLTSTAIGDRLDLAGSSVRCRVLRLRREIGSIRSHARD